MWRGGGGYSLNLLFLRPASTELQIQTNNHNKKKTSEGAHLSMMSRSLFVYLPVWCQLTSVCLSLLWVELFLLCLPLWCQLFFLPLNSALNVWVMKLTDQQLEDEEEEEEITSKFLVFCPCSLWAPISLWRLLSRGSHRLLPLPLPLLCVSLHVLAIHFLFFFWRGLEWAEGVLLCKGSNQQQNKNTVMHSSLVVLSNRNWL